MPVKSLFAIGMDHSAISDRNHGRPVLDSSQQHGFGNIATGANPKTSIPVSERLNMRYKTLLYTANSRNACQAATKEHLIEIGTPKLFTQTLFPSSRPRSKSLPLGYQRQSIGSSASSSASSTVNEFEYFKQAFVEQHNVNVSSEPPQWSGNRRCNVNSGGPVSTNSTGSLPPSVRQTPGTAVLNVQPVVALYNLVRNIL